MPKPVRMFFLPYVLSPVKTVSHGCYAEKAKKKLPVAPPDLHDHPNKEGRGNRRNYALHEEKEEEEKSQAPHFSQATKSAML